MMEEIQRKTLNTKKDDEWCWKKDETYGYTIKMSYKKLKNKKSKKESYLY